MGMTAENLGHVCFKFFLYSLSQKIKNILKNVFVRIMTKPFLGLLPKVYAFGNNWPLI